MYGVRRNKMREEIPSSDWYQPPNEIHSPACGDKHYYQCPECLTIIHRTNLNWCDVDGGNFIPIAENCICEKLEEV